MEDLISKRIGKKDLNIIYILNMCLVGDSHEIKVED